MILETKGMQANVIRFARRKQQTSEIDNIKKCIRFWKQNEKTDVNRHTSSGKAGLSKSYVKTKKGNLITHQAPGLKQMKTP